MVTSSGGADGETYMPVSMVQSWRLKKEGGFQGKERENHSLCGTHKKCECARCYPMRRRSSDQRYVAYSLTLKRDEKTLMNRHVMNEKTSQHNDDFQTNNDEAV